MDFSKSPEMAVVKQKLYRSQIPDVSGAVSRALAGLLRSDEIKEGQTVAIAVGSRGIDRIDRVVSECVKRFGEKGLKPFIVPAMGSHGGATAEGQKKILKKLGISESAIGAEIRADMTTNIIGQTPSDVKIHFSAAASEADWIFPVNRVKPHTKFKAPIESGLCKILTVGLGKSAGAAEFHRRAVRSGFGIIEEAAGIVLKVRKVLAGMALLEDGFGKLGEIEVLSPETLIQREKRLLEKAYAHMARIQLDHIDVLIVDKMGKDISGIGMDSNVTGRHRDITGDFHTAPHVKRLFARELSSGSDGNANGIGLADVAKTELVRSIDWEKTKVNAVVAISPEKAAIPIHFDTDLECLRVCASTAGIDDPESARIVRIPDTGRLEYILVSKAFEKEIESNPNLELVGSWKPIEFDSDGNFCEPELD
jgi:hypothetical protein